MFAPEMMVKQYVGRIHGAWCEFQVFETGDPKFYLFDPLDRQGCSTCMQFPVKKADLKPEVRRALKGG